MVTGGYIYVPHYTLLSFASDEQQSVMGHRLMLCTNYSLHKTSMMYRIVYTKLSYSLLSHFTACLNVVCIEYTEYKHDTEK